MRALVTGASGFVGPYLCAHLADSGDDVRTPDFDVTDRAAAEAAIADTRPDAVYHLAAQSHVPASWNDPVATLRVNVEGTCNVLDASRAAGVARVLVVGSAEEYGRVDEADLPLREDAPLRPMSPYGVSKVAASYLALQACLSTGLDVIRTRTFNHTGPGQTPSFLIPALARRIAAVERGSGPTVPVGSLDPVRDINDVRDVVRAYRLLIEHGSPGEVYNVCTGSGVTVREIADKLLALATCPIRLESDPDLLRPADVPRLIGDPTKLRDATGYTPEYSLDRTLTDVLADARTRYGS
jgi:GDP-4-dehydro-6-deoxy-D-mannose reductase